MSTFTKRNILTAAIVASTLSLAGCASMNGGGSSVPEANFTFEPKAFQELATASVEARDELRLLAKTRDSKALGSMNEQQKRQRYEQAVNVPEGFEEIATVQFTGTALDAAKLLSRLSGYTKVTEVGNKPRSPLIVSLDQRDTKLVNSLRELGMQVGDKATIEVFPSAKTIRIQYTDTDQLSSDVYNGEVSQKKQRQHKR